MATLPEASTVTLEAGAPVDEGAQGAQAAPGAQPGPDGGFQVHLENFEGPFDLLLSLISKHKLDITQIALAQVTDEFIGYIRAADRDLGTTSEFLLVAATLLDLKAARLLPSGDVEDTEDLALLEARDLLFVRLLQYRAYKQLAGVFADRLADQGRGVPRAVALEPQLASLLPELVWTTTPADLAALATRALAPRPAPPLVDTSHVHAPAVSVREEAATVVALLRRHGAATFRALVADAGSRLVVVARFLALLELFRDAVVAFDQVSALGELTVRWTGEEDGTAAIVTDFDDEPDAAASDGAGRRDLGDTAAGEQA